MEANIIKVGNSKGIIILAKFMKLIGLEKTVNIDLKNDKLVIAPVKKISRESWEEMIVNDIKENGSTIISVGNLILPRIHQCFSFNNE